MRRFFAILLLVLAGLLTVGTGLCTAMGVAVLADGRERGIIGPVLLGAVLTVLFFLASRALLRRLLVRPDQRD